MVVLTNDVLQNLIVTHVWGERRQVNHRWLTHTNQYQTRPAGCGSGVVAVAELLTSVERCKWDMIVYCVV